MRLQKKVYDIIGIGIGPFNLGLAALCQPFSELNCLFIDQQECFNWHPGMLLKASRLQVPFYADLVTLADPCSKFSYMKYLQASRQMFRFAIAENYFIRRTQYNDYCRWVADQLTSMQFSTTCLTIEKEGCIYRVNTNKGSYLSRHIVLGTGTTLYIPNLDLRCHENIFHSSDYLLRKEKMTTLKSIAIVGSGQSAAEIFNDLLQSYDGSLYWFSRAPRFYPMDYSKLSLELSTPDYIRYFHALPEQKKAGILAGQDPLYKGINACLISEIYELLLEKESTDVHLHPNCELQKITPDGKLVFLHTELEKPFEHVADAVILATGYRPKLPQYIQPLLPYIHLNSEGHYKANLNYSIDHSKSIFVQNGEQSSHGFNAADLSLGPYRNGVILNTILGYEHFKTEKQVTFQRFSPPANSKNFPEKFPG